MTLTRNSKLILILLIWLAGVVAIHQVLARAAFKDAAGQAASEWVLVNSTIKSADVAVNTDIDSDNDGLSDELERVYGTNPHNHDTDGDGYPDGLEVKNHYNPLGPGRLPTFKIAQAVSSNTSPNTSSSAAKIFMPTPVIDTTADKTAPNTLWVDSLGIKAPINFPVANNETAYQEALLTGVAHYPGTALIGQSGNMFIFGHSSDYIWSKGRYKTVFAKLPKIQTGAEIDVTDTNGKLYVYKVVNHFIAEATDVSLTGQYGYQKKLLTLQTSYPVGTAKQRYIVIAEMVE